MSNLVFSAIFKNENPYLREWIEYHLLVGVDHFYLYDNGGDPASRKILDPYIQKGIVTLHDWSMVNDPPKMSFWKRKFGIHKHHKAYHHTVENYRQQFSWIMKIDLDEFLVPINENSCLKTVLQTYDREKIKGIRIPRYNFGDNGYREKPEGLVIETYTKREKSYSNYKEIANQRFLGSNQRCGSAHFWHYRIRPGKVIATKECQDLRLHHYYTKSLAEYLMRQTIDGTRVQTEEAFLSRNAECNVINDSRLQSLVTKIKERLNQ